MKKCNKCNVEKELIQFYTQQQKGKEEPKQETLEEASVRAVKSGLFKDETLFIAGAKWQQQQMYSDEEVHKIIGSYSSHKTAFGVNFTYDRWFKQFKKK